MTAMGIAASAFRNIVVETAAYTLDPRRDPCGTLFTTRGATANVTFTLPASGSTLNGLWYEFINLADINLTVAGTSGELIAFNDLAANSVAISTSGEKIGSGFRVVNDGTSWIIFPILGQDTASVTIAT